MYSHFKGTVTWDFWSLVFPEFDSPGSWSSFLLLLDPNFSKYLRIYPIFCVWNLLQLVFKSVKTSVFCAFCGIPVFLQHTWLPLAYLPVFLQHPWLSAVYLTFCSIPDFQQHTWLSAAYLTFCSIPDFPQHTWLSAAYLTFCSIPDFLQHTWLPKSYLTFCHTPESLLYYL